MKPTEGFSVRVHHIIRIIGAVEPDAADTPESGREIVAPGGFQGEEIFPRMRGERFGCGEAVFAQIKDERKFTRDVPAKLLVRRREAQKTDCSVLIIRVNRVTGDTELREHPVERFLVKRPILKGFPCQIEISEKVS